MYRLLQWFIEANWRYDFRRALVKGGMKRKAARNLVSCMQGERLFNRLTARINYALEPEYAARLYMSGGCSEFECQECE